MYKKMVAVAGIASLLVGAAAAAQVQSIDLKIQGGHDTDSRDHGRPVILVASALGVPAQVFRNAFSHVIPAPAGQEPDPNQVHRNKDALLETLAPYGIENNQLDEVSDYYRYNGSRGETWRSRPAKITATVVNGTIKKLTVVDGGAGYSSIPALSLPGFPKAKFSSKVFFGRNLNTNGSLYVVKVIP